MAVAPEGVRPYLVEAAREAGARIVPPAEAEVLIWATPDRPDDLARLIAGAPRLRWIQLPWAGVEPFLGVLDHDHVWTAAKGVYAEPVAEHALALTLAGLREVVTYSRTRGWSAPRGRNLLGGRVLILGGGGITRALLGLLAPFRAEVTVLRRRPEPLEGATRVVGPDALAEELPGADVVILALALTPETEGIIGADELDRMASHAWLVNVARGRHVDTDALVAALRRGSIGGAALDVTDPEPLPDDHPLWDEPRCVITPHVGNTPEMAEPLLRHRIIENLRRWARDEPLIGVVDVDAGY